MITDDAAPSTNWMHGQVTAYDSGTGALTVSVSSTGGSGTHTDWTIRVSGAPGAAGSVSDGDKGDITVSTSGSVWTVDNDAITFAKMQNINTARILGRTTASAGDVEEVSVGTGLTLSAGILSRTALSSQDLPSGVKYGHQTATKTDTWSFTGRYSNGWQDITDMSVSITPANTSDKVELNVSLNISASGTGAIRIMRGATPIYIGDASSSRLQVSDASIFRTPDGNHNLRRSMTFTDSPATTSSVTYKVQAIISEPSADYTVYVNRNINDPDNTTYGHRAASSISASCIKA
jgi:hypothetical protein